MNASSLIQLILLAAIWGASFLFMRITVPYLGPVVLIEFRVLLAAMFLFAVGVFIRQRLQLGMHWQRYIVLGLFNAAIPFVLLAYAAQSLTASLLSILNATAPIWGAIVNMLWTRSLLKANTALGLALGVAGVYLLVGTEASLSHGSDNTLAIIAALTATLCYGIGSTYAQHAPRIDPHANAHGSMWAASLLLLPWVLIYGEPVQVPATIAVAVIALGVLCTGIAFILYFRLVASIGAASTLSVTYLIPLLGILWGVVFLDESIGWHTLLGTAVVLSGTTLVTGLSITRLLTGNKPSS